MFLSETYLGEEGLVFLQGRPAHNVVTTVRAWLMVISIFNVVTTVRARLMVISIFMTDGECKDLKILKNICLGLNLQQMCSFLGMALWWREVCCGCSLCNSKILNSFFLMPIAKFCSFVSSKDQHCLSVGLYYSLYV